MTTKKFSKRQVYSNWSRYEELSEAHEAWKEEKNPSADFESLLNAPVSAGGHFKFKSERSWDVNPASLYSEYFALDLDTMSQGLACIPFYQKLDLPKSLWLKGLCLAHPTLIQLKLLPLVFRWLVFLEPHIKEVPVKDEELEKMEYFVKQSAVRYNAASTTKKSSQSVNDKPVTTKLVNILSYKENNHNTDPSMYENFDEDVQLENKSLVSFSFEPKIVCQTGESVTISVHSINLNSLNRDSISENVVIHNKFTKPALSDNILEQTSSQFPKDNVSLTEKVQNNIAQDKINATKLTALRIESNKITINAYKTEERSDEKINGSIEIDLPEEDTPAKCLSDIVAEESKPEAVTEPIEQAPVLLDQRPSRQKKGHRKVGKSEKVETLEEKEPKIKVEEKKAIIENEKLLVSSKNSDAQQKEKCIEDRKLEEKKIKRDVKKTIKNDKIHKEEVMKDIEVVVKTSVEEDDLDFMLSLKKPVAEVTGKLHQSGKQGRSAIEDDEADGTNLLLLPSSVKKDENLEDWLDSMLDD
uniref:Uncharacterized protein n=1 Tax=Timema genevievae TaxID=629358 RepID=A0A7R9K6A1_TIMGE|nr:unnamed protein product [Timema genevievae]